MKSILAVVVVALVLPSASAARDDEPALTVKQLIEKLKHKEADKRVEAARELGRIGADAKEAIPALTAAVKDPSDKVRSYAIVALKQMGVEARSAIPALIDAL